MSEQTANLCTTDAAESLRAVVAERDREIERLKEGQSILILARDEQKRLANEYRDLWSRAAVKAQPGGVVLPPRASTLTGNDWDMQLAEAYNDALDEVARLNSSPVSAGDPCMCGGNPHTTQCLYEHFLSYSGLADQPTLRYAYFHGADTQCELPSAGGVGEQAAFEAWYLGHFYMGDKQCGLEWLSTEPCGGYRHQHPAEQWIVWQARAALSPVSEDVRGADPVKAQLLENALRLSANRMDRLAIEFAHGSEMRWTVSEWAEESRAALSAPSHGEQVREGLRELLDMLVASDLRKIRYAGAWRKEVHNRAVSLRDALPAAPSPSKQGGE